MEAGAIPRHASSHSCTQACIHCMQNAPLSMHATRTLHSAIPQPGGLATKRVLLEGLNTSLESFLRAKGRKET